MATTPFSEKEKVKILRYIGWDVRLIEGESVFFSNVIEDRINLDPTSSDRISAVIDESRELLNRIIALDQQVQQAPSRLKINSVSNVRLNNSELNQLRSERDNVIAELCVVLRVYPPESYGIQLG